MNSRLNADSANSYLNMRPSLAMEYSILGNGRSAPSRDDVSAQRAPIAIIYLAQVAPLKANTLGNVPPSGRLLEGHIRVRTVDTLKYATKQIPVLQVSERVLKRLMTILSNLTKHS